MADTPFSSAEELAHYVQTMLGMREFDKAISAIQNVDSEFPDDPIVQHLAGLVWERTYLERNAEDKAPGLDLYESAERHYRRALELDPDQRPLHGERLFTCLFVLGTQNNDQPRLEEALALALELAQNDDPTLAETYKREAAIVLTAIARISQDPKDWDRANEQFDSIAEPESDREAYFFLFYRGMVKRAVAHRLADQQAFADAVSSLGKARRVQSNRGLDYLLADCLVEIKNPSQHQIDLLQECLGELQSGNPDDKFVETLLKRWQLRQQLLDSEKNSLS